MIHLTTDWRIWLLLITWMAGAVLMLKDIDQEPFPGKHHPLAAAAGAIVLSVGWPLFWAWAVGEVVLEGAVIWWRNRKG